MKSELAQLFYKVNCLIEEGEISLLFNDIKNDISNQISNTKPNEGQKREELYFMTYGITLLERKMTELSNEFKQENE